VKKLAWIGFGLMGVFLLMEFLLPIYGLSTDVSFAIRLYYFGMFCLVISPYVIAGSLDKKLAGLLLFLFLIYALLLWLVPEARSLSNHENVAKRIGRYGILCLGVAPLIISGGIDLSIGSVVCFCATVLAILVNERQWDQHLAVAATLGIGLLAGLINGLLVTRLRLQPFVVTLCGLFIYRGLSRWIADDETKGVRNYLSFYVDAFTGDIAGIPKFFVIFIILACVLSVIVHLSVYGRYWQAIGANEKTALYSGIAVNRYKVAAYMICSLAAAFSAVLFLAENRSAMPSTTASFYELYAIAGAVLGGISLRGGEGNIFGVILGTTILWILPNFTVMTGIKDALQDTVIGGALLISAILDELLRRRVSK
jgi:ribose transport system permease protein